MDRAEKEIMSWWIWVPLTEVAQRSPEFSYSLEPSAISDSIFAVPSFLYSP